MSAPRILHVLPHAGGGGETYVEQLRSMPGFRFERLELTRRRRPTEVPLGVVRLLRSARDHELIHIHGDSAAIACRPAIGRRPTVITLHGAHLLRRSSGLRGRAARAAARSALARADRVIAVSESELDLARTVAPAAAERMVLIHNGVPDPTSVSEEQRRSARRGMDVEDESFVALFAGELSERKQPLQFAAAVRRARDQNAGIVGVLAGNGPLRSALAPMEGSGIRLLGERDDLKQLIAAADAFVLPSLWEGLSYAALEAMSLGKPTVVSDAPGNPDAVGEAGMIFPAGDVEAMSAALLRLAGEPALRRSLGEAAAERARDRFSLERMIDATARVYEGTLGREADR